jgi:hypothetical protein
MTEALLRRAVQGSLAGTPLPSPLSCSVASQCGGSAPLPSVCRYTARARPLKLRKRRRTALSSAVALEGPTGAGCYPIPAGMQDEPAPNDPV